MTSISNHFLFFSTKYEVETLYKDNPLSCIQHSHYKLIITFCDKTPHSPHYVSVYPLPLHVFM